MQVIPQSGALGAEINGIDLAHPITESVATAIHDAFLEHQVIFFRAQDLDPHQLLRLQPASVSPPITLLPKDYRNAHW